MREQDKITARDISKMKTINMPDREIKVTVIKLLKGFGKRVEDLRTTLTKK